MPRELRAPVRTTQDNARLAAVTPDDILHAQERARRDSPRLAKMLEAIEQGEPTGPADA